VTLHVGNGVLRSATTRSVTSCSSGRRLVQRWYSLFHNFFYYESMNNEALVVGGTYVGRVGVIIKVTKHMYKIHLTREKGLTNDGNEVRVMKWNVEKILSVDCQQSSSLLVELEAMKRQLDFLLAQFMELQVKSHG
jgi:hypothetical protein